MRLPALLLVVGPTASGKSDLAVALALRLGGEIVGADSMQVYRGLDIATAKPSREARRAVPHHLIDVAEPGQDFSMGDFVRLAQRAIAGIAARGRLPIVVGGTGLYIRALLRGMFEAPRRDERLRARLREVGRRRGAEVLHGMLARVDPEGAERIAPTDPQRIVRALEVFLLTRRPLSSWFREEGFGPELYPTVKLAIELPRDALYRRIDERVEGFFRSGLVGEVRGLLASGVPAGANALKALGYREVVAMLRDGTDERRTMELIRSNTRHYAKRQLTWFRREPGVNWLDGRLAPAEWTARAEALAREGLSQAPRYRR